MKPGVIFSALGMLLLAHVTAAKELAVTHVTVIDATGAAAKPDQTVLITDERIIAIAPASTARIPAGAKIVAARGKYVIPGLWDLHVHLNYSGENVLPVFVAYGITGVREMSTAMPEIQRLRELGRTGTVV